MPRFRLRQVLLYKIQHERQPSIGLEAWIPGRVKFFRQRQVSVMPRFRLRQVLLYKIQHERQSSTGLEVWIPGTVHDFR